MKQIRHVIFFANGTFTCTDAEGNQIPEFQRNLLSDYIRTLERQGAFHFAATVRWERGPQAESSYKDWL